LTIHTTSQFHNFHYPNLYTMNEAIKFEQIHSYLNGELSGTTLTDFEAQMKSDPALKAEVDLYRDIDIALMDDDKIPFIQSMNKIHEVNQEERIPAQITTPNSRRRIFRYAVAAAVAILLAVFVVPLLLPPPDAMQLSENTIGAAPMLDTKRSESDNFNVTKEAEAINQKIIEGEYAAAIPLLTDLYSQTGDNNDALSLGYCHLQVKNYDNGIAVFKEIIAKKTNINDAANWYLAHIYLRKGEKETAKNILKQLIQGAKITSQRRKQAENLINSIENIN